MEGLTLVNDVRDRLLQSELNLCHENALTTLEWDSVLQLASNQADTIMGHEAVRCLSWAENSEALHQQQLLLQEVLQWIAWQPLTLRGAGPIGELAEQAHKGHVLTPNELWIVADTLLRAHEVVTTIPSEQCPIWSQRVTHWIVPRELATVIREILTPEGEVRDDASPTLRDIRRKRRAILGEIDTTLQQLLHSPSWASYLQEPVVTVRFGRRVVPVKYMFRNTVPGIVHDQSASGQTVFVEPLSIVERQNAVVSLDHDEREEIERILQELSQRVGSFDGDLAHLQRELTDLDRTLALARYGTAHESVIPHVGGDSLRLIDARHPLLDNPVPLSLRLDAEKRILVITGPNTGGKTVAMKTAGLMVACAMSGMMVPAREGTIMPFITGILADIGDEQSLEQNLSTFSSHVRRLVPMVQWAGRDTLCLIDELGAGTDPEEGAALAESILERLNQQQAYVMATTHYNRLKLLGFHDPVVVNAHVAFDTETLEPTYHLVMGQPGSSHAFSIAERLGMPKEIVDRGRELMTAESLALTEAIAAVNQLDQDLRERQQQFEMERRQWELAKAQKDLEQTKLQDRLEQDRRRLRETWTKALEQTKAEIDRLMEEVRRTEGQERARAIEQLRSAWREQGTLPEALKTVPTAGGPRPTSVGDWVKIRGFSDLGHILEIEGPMALIEVGSLRIRLALNELERAAKPKSSVPRRATAKPVGSPGGHIEVDVRGMSAEDAWEVVDRFLDNAVLSGWPMIRIIHGKGTGTLRRVLGERLRQDSRVVSLRLGAQGEGGDGVTVAWLDEEPS